MRDHDYYALSIAVVNNKLPDLRSLSCFHAGIIKEYLIQTVGTDKVTIFGDVPGGKYTGKTQVAVRSPEVAAKIKFTWEFLA